MESYTKNVIRVANELNLSPRRVAGLVRKSRRYAALMARVCNVEVPNYEARELKLRNLIRLERHLLGSRTTFDFSGDPRGYCVTVHTAAHSAGVA